MMFGGGLDVKASRHLGLRAIQFDWLGLHSNGAATTTTCASPPDFCCGTKKLRSGQGSGDRKVALIFLQRNSQLPRFSSHYVRL